MPIKILLIEDNPDHIEITKRVLRETGEDYQVDYAMESHEGMKKLFEGSYDVVLCDYRLPDLTAFDILKEMNSKGKDTPFIVVTALGNEKVAVDLMKEGAYDYIVKDVLYTDTLGMVIKKTVSRYKMKKEKERLEEEIRTAYEKLKQTQDQLVQAEKLSAVGQLASGVAHEVKNPLSIILQGINCLENKISPQDKDVAETLAMLKDSVKRADKIINDLLDFAKASTLDLGPQDINVILEVSLNLLKARLKLENIDIIMETKKEVPKILADKNKLEQVFINILLNSVQAMPNGGKIIIRTYDKQLEEARGGVGRRREDLFQIGERVVMVEIEDTGVGIIEEHLKKVFDPFFTTKGPRAGTGLGLSVTKNIINMHKGLINIESRPGQWTKAIVTLKIAKS